MIEHSPYTVAFVLYAIMLLIIAYGMIYHSPNPCPSA